MVASNSLLEQLSSTFGKWLNHPHLRAQVVTSRDNPSHPRSALLSTKKNRMYSKGHGRMLLFHYVKGLGQDRSQIMNEKA